MTEYKRFTVDNDGKYWDKFNNCYVTVDYLLDLSNCLSEENEQLKELNDVRLEYVDKCAKEKEKLVTKCNTLKKENEQLKHLSEGNEEQLLKVMTYLHDNYYELWGEVNKESYE